MYIGEPSKNYMNFSIERGNVGEFTKDHGIEFGDNSISGFCSSKTEIFFSLSPGSVAHHICVPKALLLDTVNKLYGLEGLMFLEQNHTCRLSKIHKERIWELTKYARTNPEPGIEIKLIVQLLESIFGESVTTSETPALDIVTRFVQQAKKFGGPKPLSVSDIAAQLYTSKTTLSDQLKKLTGLSPSVFLDMCYLEQARNALSDPLDKRSVAQIGKDYGLGTRFSSKYLKKYGESPSATKQRLKPLQLECL